MRIAHEILKTIHDAGITLVILALMIKAGQEPKYIYAYGFFIGFLLLICKLSVFY